MTLTLFFVVLQDDKKKSGISLFKSPKNLLDHTPPSINMQTYRSMMIYIFTRIISFDGPLNHIVC